MTQHPEKIVNQYMIRQKIDGIKPWIAAFLRDLSLFTIEYYRSQLAVFETFCKSNDVTEVPNITADIAPRTVYRWMQAGSFRTAFTQAQGEVLIDAVRTLVADMQKKHQTMMEIRDNVNNDDSVRLRAAQALDNSLLHWRELGNVEDHLSELERIVHNASKRHG